jgi:hypothetical protein
MGWLVTIREERGPRKEEVASDLQSWNMIGKVAGIG